MINAKIELVEAIKKSKSNVKCIKIALNNSQGETVSLPIGYTDEEVKTSLNSLDFEYDEYESSLSGYVWFDNGDFLKRHELGDGSWYWKLIEVPKIPESLMPTTIEKPNFWYRLFDALTYKGNVS